MSPSFQLQGQKHHSALLLIMSGRSSLPLGILITCKQSDFTACIWSSFLKVVSLRLPSLMSDQGASKQKCTQQEGRQRAGRTGRGAHAGGSAALPPLTGFENTLCSGPVPCGTWHRTWHKFTHNKELHPWMQQRPGLSWLSPQQAQCGTVGCGLLTCACGKSALWGCSPRRHSAGGG